ncbi:hypothetical protein [Campylobacter concisus]|uniref:hypothetical protein n=1 Tax=Campylobacter concisus TaxID=199 RepID=UPI000D303120|nr:hypothetical protein [Campylobacter concisus]
MKYAHYNKETNEILGFYDDDIHEIPEPNIKITYEQWQEAINTNANYVGNNKLIYKQKELSAEDKKQNELNELETQIKETEELIRNALLIGNNAVLEELRAEYKELLNQKEILKGEDNEKEN